MARGTLERYSIHGIFTFDICDQASLLVQRALDVQGRYRVFQTRYDPAVPPDLRITIGSFEPDTAGCVALDNAYWVKRDYLCHRGETYKLGAFWRFDVAGMGAETVEVRIDANLQGRPFIAGKIIDFFVFYLLQQRGYSLLHASAVARAQDVYLFAARGGGGKTTLALAAALGQGLQFLGDNFVILKDGVVLSYLSEINLFKYNLHPAIWPCLTAGQRFKFNTWQRVYRWSRGYIKVFTAVSPLRFLPDAGQKQGKLRRLSLLHTCQTYTCQPQPREALLLQLVSNLKLEFFSFVRHAAMYGVIFPEADFARVWQNYARTLQANLPEEVELQRMTLPPAITEAVKAQTLAAGGWEDG